MYFISYIHAYASFSNVSCYAFNKHFAYNPGRNYYLEDSRGHTLRKNIEQLLLLKTVVYTKLRIVQVI